MRRPETTGRPEGQSPHQGIPRWRSPQRRYRPAHHHPALLIEMAAARGLAEHRLLRHTGLFMEDILTGTVAMSDEQYRRLMDNARQHPEGPALALLWGRQFFPGHYGPLSTLIQHAPNLLQALEGIHRYRAHLCPLVSPRWEMDRHNGYIVWIDSGGCGPARPFATVAMMAALYGLYRHRTGERPGWRFLLAGRAPGSQAHYQVNLGRRIEEETGLDALILPKEDLLRPWEDSSTAAYTVAARELAQAEGGPVAAAGLPEAVYRYLLRQMKRPTNLEMAAAAFDLSPSGLKRRLKGCGTSFRQIQDEARLHYALYLSQLVGLSNEDIAEQLAQGDTTNFRRLFRRWTGRTPAQFRLLLAEPVR